MKMIFQRLTPVCWGCLRGLLSPAGWWTDFSRGWRCCAQGWPEPGCPPPCQTPGRCCGYCTDPAHCTTQPREEWPDSKAFSFFWDRPTKHWKQLTIYKIICHLCASHSAHYLFLLFTVRVYFRILLFKALCPITLLTDPFNFQKFPIVACYTFVGLSVLSRSEAASWIQDSSRRRCSEKLTWHITRLLKNLQLWG